MPLSHLEKASLTVRQSVATCGWGGSAVHVMLALCHRSREIGVTDAELRRFLAKILPPLQDGRWPARSLV